MRNDYNIQVHRMAPFVVLASSPSSGVHVSSTITYTIAVERREGGLDTYANVAPSGRPPVDRLVHPATPGTTGVALFMITPNGDMSITFSLHEYDAVEECVDPGE